MTCSQGSLGTLFIKTAATALSDFDSGATCLEFKNESVRATDTVEVGPWIRGSRSRYSSQARLTRQSVGGSIVIPFNANYAGVALTRGYGGSSPFSGANALTAFGIAINRTAERYVYGGCIVNSLIFRCQTGQLGEIELGVIGKTEEKTNTAIGQAAAYFETDPYVPFQMSDMTYSIDGTASGYTFNSFELSIQNKVEARFTNSVTATDVCPHDREVMVTLGGFLGDNDLLHALAGDTAVNVTLTFTYNATVSVIFDMDAVRPIRESPTIPGRSDIPYTFKGQALSSGVTAELVATVDEAL